MNTFPVYLVTLVFIFSASGRNVVSGPMATNGPCYTVMGGPKLAFFSP